MSNFCVGFHSWLCVVGLRAMAIGVIGDCGSKDPGHSINHSIVGAYLATSVSSIVGLQEHCVDMIEVSIRR